ncbi:MAG: CHAD domain-containing protein [Luteolibacter sp.]
MIAFTAQAALAARQRLLIGCEDMIAALEDLSGSRKHIAGQIHSLRKLGKTLRGGGTLFGENKTAVREIQAVGRLLSERRDATSRRKTWEKLRWKPRHPGSQAIVGLLNQQVTAAGRKPPEPAIAWCVNRISEAKNALSAIPEEELPDRLQAGFHTLEKQLIKRGKQVARRGDEDFHNFRKSIKALLGACKFFPEITHSQAITLDHLADILGDENDLATLALWLEQHGFTAALLPDLWNNLEKSRKALQDEVLEKVPDLQIDKLATHERTAI